MITTAIDTRVAKRDRLEKIIRIKVVSVIGGATQPNEPSSFFIGISRVATTFVSGDLLVLSIP